MRAFSKAFHPCLDRIISPDCRPESSFMKKQRAQEPLFWAARDLSCYNFIFSLSFHSRWFKTLLFSSLMLTYLPDTSISKVQRGLYFLFASPCVAFQRYNLQKTLEIILWESVCILILPNNNLRASPSFSCSGAG